MTEAELDDYELQFDAIAQYGDSVTMTLDEARAFLAAARKGIARKDEAPLDELQRLGQEYDAAPLTTTEAAPMGDEATMRAFGASDAACYRYPDDTPEHRLARQAYMEGVADCAEDTHTGQWCKTHNARWHFTDKKCDAAANPSPQADAGEIVKRIKHPREPFPIVPAAFVNAIAEEGTKAEAVQYLQKEWSEKCWWRDRANEAASLIERQAAEIERLEAAPMGEIVTDEMIEAGSQAIDDYYNGTKDAPFEGSVEACYRAMRTKAPNPSPQGKAEAAIAVVLKEAREHITCGPCRVAFDNFATHWMPLPSPPNPTPTQREDGEKVWRPNEWVDARWPFDTNIACIPKPSPQNIDVEKMIDRLYRLGWRRESEGIYTDQNICEEAASLIERQAAEIKSHITNAENCYEEWKKVKKEADKLRAQLGELQMANNSNLAVIERQAAEIERLKLEFDREHACFVHSYKAERDKSALIDKWYWKFQEAQAEIEHQAAFLKESERQYQEKVSELLEVQAEIERLRLVQEGGKS